MSKYVAVKHSIEQDMVYWFAVPDTIRDIVNVRSNVLCDTKKGINPGFVVSLIDGLDIGTSKRIIGRDYFPPKSLVGVFKSFPMDQIYIPYEIEIGESPSAEELSEKINEFYSTGTFNGIRFKQDGTLVEGYSSYLVARMFDHEKLCGIVKA